MISKYSCEYEYDNPDDHCDTCDSCTCHLGRTLDVVNQYASTCDGCGEMTTHEEMEMDEETQLGCCENCVKKMKNR